MGGIADVVRTLGGPRLVPARSPGELRDALRAGLPYASLSAVAAGLRARRRRPSRPSSRIPARTLARRKKRAAPLAGGVGPALPPRPHRRAGRGRARRPREGRRAGSHADNRALGGATPLSRLDTDLGAEEVEAVLLRLAHGVVG